MQVLHLHDVVTIQMLPRVGSRGSVVVWPMLLMHSTLSTTHQGCTTPPPYELSKIALSLSGVCSGSMLE